MYHGRDSSVSLGKLRLGTRHYYRLIVRDRFDGAFDTAGSLSLPAGFPPRAPRGLLATAYRDGISLQWACSAGVTEYRVYRSLSSGSGFQAIGSLAGTSYDDSATSGLRFYYLIAAFSRAGEGSPGSVVSGAVLTPPALIRSTGFSTHIRVAWPPDPQARGYYVKRSTAPAGTHTVIDTTSDTVSNDTLTSSEGPLGPAYL